MSSLTNQHDFSQGSIAKHIVRLALPMTLAQMVNVLYNIVDRIFIGRIPENATESLTGLGVCFPVITIVIAFANLIGTGGAPLFSIARGKGENEEAEWILGNSFSLLVFFGLVLTVVMFLVKKPVLFLLGASTVTYPYADAYLSIYLTGSVFVMVSLGLNSFINGQGFAKMAMATVATGAVVNIALDPIFIFTLGMGIQGAALATVISQAVSAAVTVKFLTGRKTLFQIRKNRLRLKWKRIKRILGLGTAGFTMSVTNSVVQMVCNASLQVYGGDIYIGVMTVINSVREVVQMPVFGASSSTQPIMSYNYGAKEYARVRTAIKYMTSFTVLYTLAVWLVLFLFPAFFIRIFNDDPHLLEVGVESMHVYFFGFFMMAFQFSGQSTFTALGKSKRAIFFSIFRKIIIVVPLILLLPGRFGFGVAGVFLAEPISNFIGGSLCFVTMLLSLYYKELKG